MPCRAEFEAGFVDAVHPPSSNIGQRRLPIGFGGCCVRWPAAREVRDGAAGK